MLAQELLRARAHRDREILDLLAGVVVVELARHRGALPLEQAARSRRRAPPGGRGRRAAGRSDWPRRTRPSRARRVRASLRPNRSPSARMSRDDRLPRGGREEDVDEAGARDLDLARRDRDVGSAATSACASSRGLRFSALRELQRDVGRVVAVLRPASAARARRRCRRARARQRQRRRQSALIRVRDRS